MSSPDRRPDGADAGGQETIVVEVPSVERAGHELTGIAARLDIATTSVRARLEDGLSAFAPSDLLSAYEYFAGRWSRQLRDAADELHRAGEKTVLAGQTYTATDRLPRGRNVPE